MVHVPTTESATPEVATPVAEQAAPVAEVKETKKAKKAREAAEKKAAAEAAALANPPVEGAPVEPPKKGEHGILRSKDLPWSAKKVAVLSMLKALGANSNLTAKSAKEVIAAAALAGIELVGRDVRHYCYHAAAGGLAGVADKLPEGAVGGGYGFYLTQTGMDTDFDAVTASLVKPVEAEAAPATTVPTEVAAS